MMRVLVTGSRDWVDALVVREALRECGHPADLTLVHGDARGADRMAAAEAARTGWEEIEAHPANWRDLGRRAGYVRNEHMVNLGADVCLAFIRSGSRGATHTADLAESRGIPVRRFLAD